MIEFTDKEIQEEREALVADLPEKYGESMEALRSRYNHEIALSEIMHPAFMLCEIVDGYLAESPCVLFDEEAYRQAHLASTALFNLYQRLGALRYQAEVTYKTTPSFNLGPGNNGRWLEVFYMLGRAMAIDDTVRAGLAQSLFVYADDPESDEVGISVAPPNIESFRYLLEFLGQRTWLQQPSLNVDKEGIFSLFYAKEDGTERWSIKFAAIDNHEVSHTVNRPDTFGAENISRSVEEIKLPEWLR